MKIDTNRLKTVSFKTTEQLWDDFIAATHKNGTTVTNVLEALMAGYITDRKSVV